MGIGKLIEMLSRNQKRQINCNTTPCSECVLNALAIDEPLEYARLYLNGNIQMWADEEDSFEVW